MENIVHFLSYLNPFSTNFFGYRIIVGIIEGFKEFFIGNEENGTLGIFDFLGNIVSFFSNFFDNLLSFFIHIFIPTDNQWNEIKNYYSDLGELIKSKLPFTTYFKENIVNAQTQVFAPNDFLNITIPSFSYYGGRTEELHFVSVRDAYEPYRIQIRSLLALVVYGCGLVFLVKNVLNYNATACGIEEAQLQSHLRGKGD